MTGPLIVRLDVPATFGDVRTIDSSIVQLLRRAGETDEGMLYNMELAVHEICSNIVEHAYAGQPAGRIEVTLTLSSRPHRELSVELRDTGRPFDPGGIASVDLDVPQEGGYGLFLAEALMDEVQYERQKGRNVWRLSKKW